MDRKGSRKSPHRPGKPRKRKFSGNQHTLEEDLSFTSASAAKLKSSNDDEILIDYNFGYCILEFCSVFSSLALMIICATCKQKMSFSRTAAQGLGFKIGVQYGCKDTRYIQSCPFVNKAFEINRRIVTAMRLIGVGREGINIFFSIMDIGHGLTIGTYYNCLDNLHLAASTIYNLIISKAVKKENELITASDSNADPTHFTVSGNGTWKKRGFNSLFGVTTLVGKYSKKVIDTVVKSSFCQGCNYWKNKKKDDISAYEDWYNEHEDSCAINHQGSAGNMEVDAVVEMFRSISEMATQRLLKVQKRMGSRLRKVKKENSGIGGKGAGKLTDKVITQLSAYYGLAIRRHPESVEDMKREIWATYLHKILTDKKPQHMNCPPGPDSWCKWQKAAAEGTEDDFHHENPPLTDKVLIVMKPIYECLSDDSLLERCLGSETQNNNESLNSLIWTFAPKHIHAGSQTIEIANCLEVCIFNEGFYPILQIMSLMGIKIGLESHGFAVRRNAVRIERFEVRASDASKEERTARYTERNAENSQYEVEEGPMYEAGMAD
ncbi:uncharacterized protein LOC123260423 [Cotesia glomerata]|uniref:uncharacterized protein LOC123260423 n=1 Tax=Cotesia glomerata TaxID=32391 RepID=UPI001D019023|nr:uncharacterized protein LOC123260423 [Cotesia glomerata]